jgi:hypothetical protein
MSSRSVFNKLTRKAGCLWLTPTQEAEIRRIVVRSQHGQIVHETLSQKKTLHKKGLMEWLKVKALSSSPSTAKKERREGVRGEKSWLDYSLGTAE